MKECRVKQVYRYIIRPLVSLAALLGLAALGHPLIGVLGAFVVSHRIDVGRSSNYGQDPFTRNSEQHAAVRSHA